MKELDVRNDLNSKELSAVLWACIEKLNNMEDGKARDNFNEIVMKLQSRQCELQEIEKAEKASELETTESNVVVHTLEEAFNTKFVKDIKDYAETCGYRLIHCWYLNSMFSFSVSSNQEYSPDIYMDGYSTDKLKFSMQTTSYGSLADDELENYIDGVNRGYALVKYLNNVDWSKSITLER